eukprot:4890964-Prorocentrum_lima.AAC.1
MITTTNPNGRPHLGDFYGFLKGCKCPYGDARAALEKGCKQWMTYPTDVNDERPPGTGIVGAQEAVRAAMGTG